MGISDIAAAFLQAPLYKEGEVRKKHILMKPPDILVRLGYVRPGELWYVEGAVYGLKISPKRWGNHRDEVIAKTMWIQDGFVWRFEQCWSEPNLWKIKARKEPHVGNKLQEESTVGMMLIYVDDLMVCSSSDVQEKVWSQIKGLWKIADPAYAEATKPIKFLGMNIYSVEGEGFYINQQPFIQELVKRYGLEGEKSGTPMSTRDVADIPEEPSRSATDIKEAQKIAGELLWISTRTRPDISYGVSRLCSSCAKSPKWVVETGKQIVKFLNKTQDLSIKYEPPQSEEKDLQVWTDASFAPGGGLSHGGLIITWKGSPVVWRSSRQPFPALSTSEAELIEMVEGVVAGDSIEVLLEEVTEEKVKKELRGDNSAAVSMCTGDGSGSWRMRHLRLRASHLRWKVDIGDWEVHHHEGKNLIADMTTKPLTADKVRHLNALAGICSMPDHLEPEEPKLKEARFSVNAVRAAFEVDMQNVVKMIALLGVLQKVKVVIATNGTGEEGGESSMEFSAIALLLMLLGVVLYKLIERLVGWARTLMTTSSPSTTTSMAAAASSASSSSRASEEVSREVQISQKKVEVKVSISEEREEDPEQGMRERRVTPKPKVQPSSRASLSSASNAQQAEPRLPLWKFMIPEYGTKYHWDPDCPTLANSRKSMKRMCEKCNHLYYRMDPIYVDDRLHASEECSSAVAFEKRLACKRCDPDKLLRWQYSLGGVCEDQMTCQSKKARRCHTCTVKS